MEIYTDLISIVVPVYNVKNFFRKSLDSIIFQTYKNIEIILVDDGSTDGSSEICDEYALKNSKIKCFHKKNGGLSDARNFGLKHLSGKYVVFVDSDDVISSNLVEYLYNSIKKNNVDIAICDPLHCTPKTKIVFCDSTIEKIFTSEQAINELFYQNSFSVSACGKIFPVKLFENVKFPKGMLFEDSAIMYKLFEKTNSIFYGNAKLYGYMHHENSITTKTFSKSDFDIITICNEIESHYSCMYKIKQSTIAYKTNACLRVCLNAPKREFIDEVKQCQNYIKINAKKVIKDKEVRRKTKIALILWMYARPLIFIIYKHVDRWK